MGRWQKLGEQPLTVCDTGHNPTASPTSPGSSKPRFLQTTLLRDRLVRDKDLAHILPLLPHDAHYIFTQAEDRTGLLPPSFTAKAAIYGLHGETVAEVPAAVARAKELAGADDMIFIGGAPCGRRSLVNPSDRSRRIRRQLIL